MLSGKPEGRGLGAWRMWNMTIRHAAAVVLLGAMLLIFGGTAAGDIPDDPPAPKGSKAPCMCSGWCAHDRAYPTGDYAEKTWTQVSGLKIKWAGKCEYPRAALKACGSIRYSGPYPFVPASDGTHTPKMTCADDPSSE